VTLTPPSARTTNPQPPPQGAAAIADVTTPSHDAPARRRANPREVIQNAVDAIADTYRERLQTILEHQDGPSWLAELNLRRRISMTQDGKAPPRDYEWLEPRAVLTCLAYDPAGLQLISASAAKSAKQLSGLINDAPPPQTPNTAHRSRRLSRLAAIHRHQRPRPAR